MPYLIDGHNLIPKIGLDLAAQDDELALMNRLQEFCRLSRSRVEVFFDGAPPGTPAILRLGAVSAHFIRRTSSADSAIEARLSQLGHQARNWTVVSSDHRVQAAGRAMHAKVVSSEGFAERMRPDEPSEEGAGEPAPLDPRELQEWLELFGGQQH
jgi:hypothetical protein